MAVPSPASDPRLNRARAAVLLSLATSVAMTLTLPGIGIALDPRPSWRVLGTIGVLAVAATQTVALHATLTPGRSRSWTTASFALAAVVSVPLVAPVGVAQGWETWGWLGAAVAGSAPLLVGWRAGLVTAAAVTALSALVGAWVGGSPVAYALLTAATGAGLVAVHGLPLALWTLVLEARDGRDAVGRLAAAEERLRFARDVHDLLGHHLTVIALKAELAQRLAPTDAPAAAREAGAARELAAAALAQLRQVVHGYRTVDLGAQLDAIATVLRSSGVRCTLAAAAADLLPAATAAVLAATAREAGTNVLRHSRARWCTIELVQRGDEVRLSVANDGAGATGGGDVLSSGLRGLAERLTEAGGGLRTSAVDGVFTLDATVPVP